MRIVISDIQKCNLDCLDHDAFDFPGAANVTTLNIQYNNFLALPEMLLWKMTSLQQLRADYLVKLATLPERFFQDKSQLKQLYFIGSVNLGVQERSAKSQFVPRPPFFFWFLFWNSVKAVLSGIFRTHSFDMYWMLK